ncbi:Disease resistance protein family [Quillaja saponaria]|uniref:Disease resistance protein family n=1 Tax=Quillaja saponaria TaxID=32244 RepID=A0AAD7L5K1_QUISA|nr:Disease resistance protein family [Quillaja saponaria]
MIPFANKFVELLIEKAWNPIQRQVEYLIFYERNIKELKEKVETLQVKKQSVENSVHIAESNDEGIEVSVQIWKGTADALTKATEEFPEHKGRLRTGCSSGFIPFLWHRHQLSRKAKVMTAEVVKIQTEELGNVAHKKPLSENAKFRNTSYEEFASRNQTLEDIMKALEDPNVKMIGVYGPGGVGKTTLMTEVAKKAKEGNLFDTVALANVTHNPNIKGMQEQLADMLGLKFQEESVTGRAARLCQRLRGTEDKKKNVLVILDDLWAGLDLRDLGIPSGDEPMEIPSGDEPKENPSGEKPKNKDVLSKMDVKKDSNFELRVLNEEEAEELFKKVAGLDNDPSDQVAKDDKTYGELAVDAAKKCAGLPVAIVAVAGSLKNKSLSHWKAALEQLERNNYSRDLIDPADRSIKIGYDYLESEELKSIFLLCARMGHDPLIKDLVNYSLGLSLFQGVYSIKEAEHKVDESITKLKALGLLEDSYSSDRFTMHGIVRHVAMLIASKDHQVLALRNGKLSGWPDKDEMRNCTAISLHNSDIGDELPEGFDCPRLKELYLENSFHQWEAKEQASKTRNASIAELRDLHQLRALNIQISDATTLPRNLFFDKLERYKILVGHGWGWSDASETRTLMIDLHGSTDVHLQNGIEMLFKQVEHLFLRGLNGIRNVVNELNWEAFPHLTHLHVGNNDEIQYIISSEEQKNLQNSFPELEELYLKNLTKLETICYGLYTEKSFSRLKRIYVYSCDLLKKLFSCSMVEHLTQLESIDVSECKNLQEIVLLEVKENSCDNDEADKSIKFPQLRELKLKSLPALGDFYNKRKTSTISRSTENQLTEIVQINAEEEKYSSVPLFDNKVSFPKLTMKYLLSTSMAASLVKLVSLSVEKCERMGEIIREEENTNDEVTIFPNLKEIRVVGNKNLTMIWPNKCSPKSFGQLQSCIVRDCEKIDTIFPSYMLGKFHTPEKLWIFECNSLKKIFDVDIEQTHHPVAKIRLRDICLIGLSRLEHIWNKDLQGTDLDFRNLRSVTVSSCHSLGNIFPLSVAKPPGLVQLERLYLRYCCRLQEIVASSTQEDLDTSITFEFPTLTILSLRNLYKLKSFYGGKHNFKCPDTLKTLKVTDCNNLTALAVENTHPSEPPMFSIEEVIPKLEKLAVGDEHVKWIMRDNYSMGLFCNLKSIRIDNVDEEEFPYWLLHRTPYLERLHLSDSSFKMVFPSGSVAVPEIHTLTVVQIRRLWLLSLPNLEYICKEGFQLDPVLQMLEYLEVDDCSSLTNLVPSSVSFNHLTFLDVQDCKRLMYLMASSTAKSLTQLITMRISCCPVIKQIVLKEEGDEREDEIVFRQMRTLEIYYLHNLESFSASDIVLKFPLLGELYIHECPKMKIFSEGVLSMPKLQEVHIDGKIIDERHWGGDLNGTIEKSSTDKVIKVYGEEELQLSYYPWLKEIWQPKFPLPDKLFCNLKSLVVYMCEFLPNSIVLPSHLLISLNNLEKLEVRNCNSVEVIFDVKGINETEMRNDGPAFPLKALTLDQLPKLEHVWNKDPQETLIFEILQEVNVNKCECLKNLFPASVARNLPQLEKLEVKDSGLQQIVSKDDAIDNIKFVFHHLTTLILWNLPKLENFYPGRHTLEWLMLKEINVYGCVELVMFSSKSQSYNNGRRSLVSAEQLFHNCEELSLNRKDYKVLSSGKLETNLLSRLNRCSSLKNLVPSLVSSPNLTTLKVSNCDGLEKLLTSSIAKSLVHLKVMDIRKCQTIKEIIAMEEDESEDEINFKQLISLTLIDLQMLASFSTGTCSLKFPSLENLIASQCPKMKIFSPRVICAPNLKEVQIADPRITELFEKQVAELLCEAVHLDLADSIQLKGTWHGNLKLPDKCFCNLRTLIVYKCQFLPNATVLPSHILVCLNNLEKLVVRNCISVEAIFDVRGINEEEMRNERTTPFRLKTLALYQLINLRHVWNKDPQGTLIFEILQEVSVENCERLKNLFPVSVARNFPRLEKLDVKYCGLEEIVAKLDEDKDIEEATIKFVFHRLTTLRLWTLPRLENFYPGKHTLEWLMLKEIDVYDCDEFVMFSSKSQSYNNGRRSLVSAEQVFPNLEDLSLNSEDYTVLSSGKLEWNLLSRLKSLRLQCFHGETDPFPIEFLKEVPNLEKLGVRCSIFREIFPFERLDVGCIEVLARLRGLSLDLLNELESIGLDHSKLDPILKNLKTLDVSRCSSLKILVPSLVSLPNLTTLEVYNCDGLEKLLTSSTAKSLVHLKVMDIRKCQTIKEIIAMEEGESEDEINFKQLISLTLTDLQMLASFSTGTCSLKFPSLEKLIASQCPQMKIFSQRVICAPNLKEVQIADTRITELFEKQHVRLSDSETELKRNIEETFMQDLDYDSNDEQEDENNNDDHDGNENGHENKDDQDDDEEDKNDEEANRENEEEDTQRLIFIVPDNTIQQQPPPQTQFFMTPNNFAPQIRMDMNDKGTQGVDDEQDIDLTLRF